MATSVPRPRYCHHRDSGETRTLRVSVSVNSILYRIKGQSTIVYKFKGEFREYQLQKAAGNCAIPVRGRVLGKSTIGNGETFFCGFLMDLATPIVSTSLSPSQRHDIMHQMIRAVQRLHDKGIIHGDIKLENVLLDLQGQLRLCNFGESRYVDEGEHIWDGASTLHFESPNRLFRAQHFGRDPPQPTPEDDLYGLGVSIWELYTGRIPHSDIAGDDLELEDRQRNGETVDVAAVDDLDARGIITSLLCKGGARIA